MSLDCVSFISQRRQPRVYRPLRKNHVSFEAYICMCQRCFLQNRRVETCSHNFLAKRRALNDSKRLLSFLWPAWQSFERERDFRFGRVRRRKGKFAYFSLARAHACARIRFSFPFEGLPLRLPFFLDSLWCRCHLRVFFVPPYHRTKRNKSKYT